MAKAATDSNPPKSKGQLILESAILVLCLCVIALRTTFTEGPGAQIAARPINLNDRMYSLSISAVLILSVVVWLVSRFWAGPFRYRLTGIEIGLGLFGIAALTAALAAADKRAAITDCVTLFAPVLMAIMLTQILDSQRKIKLVLAAVVALGVASAYQCAYQFFVTNEIEIEQYEEAPDTKLQPLGIQPNTLAHWQFEHRLYTRGVNGFFTTRNSAGSFSLLAIFAAIALFIEQLRNRKSPPIQSRRLLMAAAVVAFVICGLLITRSKGAIAASLLAAAMLGAYRLFGSRLATHRRKLAVLCALVFIIIGGAVVLYGAAHGELPGGSSMLVRWQYWQASVKMYADHAWTGVGPGNFVYFYPHYKTAAALESVSDPHNFLLAILTQYGPLGLAGFMLMILLPLWKTTSPGPSTVLPGDAVAQSGPRKLAGASVIAIAATLLVIRPMMVGAHLDHTLDVIVYAAFVLYLAPLVAFAVGFWLILPSETAARTTSNLTAAAVLFCALTGFLINNLIDFAIFEPGILTAFWALMACLIALCSRQQSRRALTVTPGLLARLLVTAASLAVVWAFFTHALIPMVRTTNKIRQAHQAAASGDFEWANTILVDAAEEDRLSPAAPSLNARLYLERFYAFASKPTDPLLRAERCLLEAIRRNPADFKNFERLTEVYILLAETSGAAQRSASLNKAFDSAKSAVERYPGLGRLHLQLAQIAEQLGKADIAVVHYKRAVEIEDSFRDQFARMYPTHEVFSRLGEQKYQFAKQKTESLLGE
jgi:O-antigen ligase